MKAIEDFRSKIHRSDQVCSKLILGWKNRHEIRPLGFAGQLARTASTRPKSTSQRDLMTYDGEGHLITVAPTRSGKGLVLLSPTC